MNATTFWNGHDLRSIFLLKIPAIILQKHSQRITHRPTREYRSFLKGCWYWCSRSLRNQTIPTLDTLSSESWGLNRLSVNLVPKLTPFGMASIHSECWTKAKSPIHWSGGITLVILIMRTWFPWVHDSVWWPEHWQICAQMFASCIFSILINSMPDERTNSTIT